MNDAYRDGEARSSVLELRRRRSQRDRAAASASAGRLTAEQAAELQADSSCACGGEFCEQS